MKLPVNTALVIIDVQKGFDDPVWGTRNNPDAEKNMKLLLEAWRERKMPVFHVRNDSIEPNSPLRPDRPGNEIKDEVKPIKNEPLIIKTVNSALIGTDLEKRLRETGITHLVIVGITTDHCVSTTARMAGNLGFKVWVASDATATFDRESFNGGRITAEDMHDHALTSLNNEFAGIADTASILRMITVN
jgi:nicotinamidase-related amidase